MMHSSIAKRQTEHRVSHRS